MEDKRFKEMVSLIKNGLAQDVLFYQDGETGDLNGDFSYDEEDDYCYPRQHRTIYKENLCFVGDDLVYFHQGKELIGYKPIWDENGYDWEKSNEEWTEYVEVWGINDESTEFLLNYINISDDMSFEDILKEWEERPKYHNYIKNNFKDFFVK